MTRHVAVIGGGPAGLMAAEVLAGGGARVTVYEGMPSLGRKFLLAGRGGLNLTHSENLARLLGRYGTAEPRLRPAIEAFAPAALVAWCEALGQPTFVGSSGRVFPKAMKTSPLLRAWLRRLDAAGVAFKQRHRWTGWDDTRSLVFATPDGPVTVKADAAVLALGGASWPQLGSFGRLGRCAECGGHSHHPAAAGQLRIPGALVGDFPQPLRGRAPQTARTVVRRAQGARRGAHHQDRPGRGRHLRPLRPAARGHSRHGRGGPAYRSAPRHRPRRAGAAAGGAACQAVAVDVPAQGRKPFARGDRPAARGHACQLATRVRP